MLGVLGHALKDIHSNGLAPSVAECVKQCSNCRTGAELAAVVGSYTVPVICYGVTLAGTYILEERKQRKTIARAEAHCSEVVRLLGDLNADVEGVTRRFDELAKGRPWVWARLSGGDQAAFARRVGREVRAYLDAHELATSERLEGLRIYGETVLDHLDTLAAKMDALLAIAQRTDQSRDAIERQLRIQIELEYADKLSREISARQAAERAAQGVLSVAGVPGIVQAVRDKGGQAIVDALLKNVAGPQAAIVETHRQVAEWAYLVGDLDRAILSLQFILASGADDLDATNRMGILRHIRGDMVGARLMFDRVVRGGDEVMQARALGNLGLIERTCGNLNKAGEMFRSALNIDRKLGRSEGQAKQLGNLGLIEQSRGNLDGAEALFREALDIDRTTGHLPGQASQLGNLGIIEQSRGNLDAAETLLRDALEIDRKLGRLLGQANHLGNLGLIELSRKNLGGAEDLLQQALRLDRRLNRLEGQASDLGNLGVIELERGKLGEAEQLFRDSLKIYGEIHGLDGQASQFANLGDIAKKRGQIAAARDAWVQSSDLFERAGMPQMVRQVQERLNGLPRG